MHAALLVGLVVALAAPARAASDPSVAGRLPVGSTTLTVHDPDRGRTLDVELWYPAQLEGRDGARRRRRHPLVLLAHGFCGFRTNYEFLSAHLASVGFLVAAPDFPDTTKSSCDAGTVGDLFAGPAADLAFVDDVLHGRREGAAGWARAVRGRRTGLVGHSLGGFAVLRAAIERSNVRAVVGLAPASSVDLAAALAMARPRRAVLLMGGTADTTVPLETFTVPFFQGLDAPAYLVRIAGGTHSGFTDEDRLLPPDALARQQTLVRRWVTAFLMHHLAGRHRFRRHLTPRDAVQVGPDVSLETRPR